MPPSCCRCCPAALHHPACGWWGACSSLVGGAAGQDRGERRAGGRRAVSTVPEARHPGPAGRRDCSSALSHACFGLRRSATSGALFCPHCRPAPGTHQPSCAQVGLRRGACDLPPALPPPAVGPRAQGGAWSLALPAAVDVMPGARVQDAHGLLAGTWAGRLRVKTRVSRWPDGAGQTPLALCVKGGTVDVLCMPASCVRSTLPPLHPHHGSLSAEICWFGAQHAWHACDLGRARV